MTPERGPRRHRRPADRGPGAPARRPLPDTVVLGTTWRSGDGEVRVLDPMPPRDGAADLVRIVEGVRGTVAMPSTLRLRFDDGHVVPWVRRTATGMVRPPS